MSPVQSRRVLANVAFGATYLLKVRSRRQWPTRPGAPADCDRGILVLHGCVFFGAAYFAKLPAERIEPAGELGH